MQFTPIDGRAASNAALIRYGLSRRSQLFGPCL